MQIRPLCIAVALATALGFARADRADAAAFEISWTGDDGYTLMGYFTVADQYLARSEINERQVENLEFEVFRYGSSQGAAKLGMVDDEPSFNLNFNTMTRRFIVGGLFTGPRGQSWNYGGQTVGFVSGADIEGVTISDSVVRGGIDPVASTLSATLLDEPRFVAPLSAAAIPLTASVGAQSVISTPLPAPGLLLLTGLGALCLIRRRLA